MHTIIPGMLREGNGNAMPLVDGGQYQPCGHIRVLSNLVDYGMDIQAALDGPRSFAEGDVLNVEPSYDPAVVQGLLDLGMMLTKPCRPLVARRPYWKTVMGSWSAARTHARMVAQSGINSTENAVDTDHPETDRTCLECQDVRRVRQNNLQLGSVQIHRPHKSYDHFRPINDKTAALSRGGCLLG